MANIKNLKKDVDAVIFELVSDCYTYKYLFPEKDSDKIEGLINKSLDLRNNLFRKINNPEGADGKAIKKFYKSVYEELFKGADAGFQELSSFAK